MFQLLKQIAKDNQGKYTMVSTLKNGLLIVYNQQIIKNFNEINSTIGNEIIKIGAPATQELIKILDDRNKGIIAHVILSKIWKNMALSYSFIQQDTFMNTVYSVPF